VKSPAGQQRQPEANADGGRNADAQLGCVWTGSPGRWRRSGSNHVIGAIEDDTLLDVARLPTHVSRRSYWMRWLIQVMPRAAKERLMTSGNEEHPHSTIGSMLAVRAGGQEVVAYRLAKCPCASALDPLSRKQHTRLRLTRSLVAARWLEGDRDEAPYELDNLGAAA
jgi:hypothetical protein